MPGIVVGTDGSSGARAAVREAARLLACAPNAVSHEAPCSVYLVRTD